MAGLDAHLAAEGVDDTRAVGANETRLGLALERVHDLSQAQRRDQIAARQTDSETYPDFIQLGYTLRNADNEANFVLNGFDDRIRRGRWWYVEDGGIRLDLPHGLRSCKHCNST